MSDLSRLSRQLDIYCDSEPEPVPDSLVLAGLDVEHRDLTLHLQLKSPAAAAAAPAALPAPIAAEAAAAGAEGPSPPATGLPKPAKGHDDAHQPFARRVYEWGMRRRCSLRRR